MLTVCGAPVGREEVCARVILLRVGLATLRLFCIANGQERVADRRRGVRVRGRARGGCVRLKRADCRQIARLLWNLN